MRFLFALIPLLALLQTTFAGPMPIRGLHLTSINSNDIELYQEFIENVLPKEGVNLLVLELNYNFQFKSHPELASKNGLSVSDVKKLLSSSKKAGIELVPQFNCYGHQSWAEHTFKLLSEYPEFDESPGQYPNNEDIYCRSYCTLHPKVHEIVFALMDELAEAFEAKKFHVGMDEVFLIADPACSRCKGKNEADLFAHEVNKIYKHLAQSGVTMMMWGDRFLDGKTTGIGKWEASENNTAPSINMIPNDILICDWHYEKPHPTAIYFAMKGFPVLSCPWRKPEVAIGQVEWIEKTQEFANSRISDRMKGVLHTTWCGATPFIKAYYGEDDKKNKAAEESAACFKALMKELRK
ncbi:MAG: family 20 glycosylhydrolase [Candidatus Hinthialibacter antarcticus]|nr:family 20 glycosylhydrolase [Candidatus Hinthialibacter antarcticus]